jgi:hypothetical protein
VRGSCFEVPAKAALCSCDLIYDLPLHPIMYFLYACYTQQVGRIYLITLCIRSSPRGNRAVIIPSNVLFFRILLPILITATSLRFYSRAVSHRLRSASTLEAKHPHEFSQKPDLHSRRFWSRSPLHHWLWRGELQVDVEFRLFNVGDCFRCRSAPPERFHNGTSSSTTSTITAVLRKGICLHNASKVASSPMQSCRADFLITKWQCQ